MSLKTYTPQQYADKLAELKLPGATLANVCHHLRKNKIPCKHLPGVVSVEKFSRFYTMKVNEEKIISN